MFNYAICIIKHNFRIFPNFPGNFHNLFIFGISRVFEINIVLIIIVLLI